MNKRILVIAALGAVSLAGCSSKTDPNEKNFSGALAQYFDKKGDLCLTFRKWPVDLYEADLRVQKSMPDGTAGQMAALERVGLVKSADAEVEGSDFGGKPNGLKFKVKRYTLTDASAPFKREREVESFGLNGKTPVKQTDLCWGKKALGKVVKWEGPIKLGDYQEAGVTYTYKIDHLADWATKPGFQDTFGGVKAIIDGAGKVEAEHAVKLTSQGWEAKGLD